MRRRFEILRIDLAEVKRSAKALGGTVNDLYVAAIAGGAGAYHPMGPTASTAFNARTLSYMNSLDIGLNIDAGAVDDPELLRRCIEESFAELIAAGS